MLIKDKVIIITGASSGIGEATACLLAKNGAKVVLGARREDKLKEIVGGIQKDGGEAVYQVCDVAKPEDNEAIVALAMEKFGKVDVIFLNAGIMPQSPLSDLRIDEWRKMLDINVMGVLNGIAAVLPIMQKQQYGHIVTTASEAGHVVFQGGAVYSGTKFAVRAIMETLRQEEKKNKIRTTLISPGTVDTELHLTISDPERRDWIENLQHAVGLKPSDVAEATVYAIGTPDTVNVSEILLVPAKDFS